MTKEIRSTTDGGGRCVGYRKRMTWRDTIDSEPRRRQNRSVRGTTIVTRSFFCDRPLPSTKCRVGLRAENDKRTRRLPRALLLILLLLQTLPPEVGPYLEIIRSPLIRSSWPRAPADFEVFSFFFYLNRLFVGRL